ncbi:MAG: MoxR family ATPase [Phycisphaerae bacterium]
MTDPQPAPPAHADDRAAVDRLAEAHRRIRAELSKVIVGQEAVVDDLLTALFAGGHCILEGVPGLAKTLLISSLARCLSLKFKRIQFTPDLMPADITGAEMLQVDVASGQRFYRFLPGPVFANMILADEINRTPPKTQAALLEAMQERQVTVGGVSHALEPPFFVLATQNPIEQEGTYPLPEAQQDRFMFKVLVDYPAYEEEFRIATTTTTEHQPQVAPVLDAAEIIALASVVRRVPAAPAVVRYALDLARRSRPREPDAPPRIRDLVAWGAGPRAVPFLILGAKARAALAGRHHAATDDVRAVAAAVLRHRIITNFAAQAEGVTADRLIAELIEQTPVHRAEQLSDPRFATVVGET